MAIHGSISPILVKLTFNTQTPIFLLQLITSLSIFYRYLFLVEFAEDFNIFCYLSWVSPSLCFQSILTNTYSPSPYRVSLTATHLVCIAPSPPPTHVHLPLIPLPLEDRNFTLVPLRLTRMLLCSQSFTWIPTLHSIYSSPAKKYRSFLCAYHSSFLGDALVCVLLPFHAPYSFLPLMTPLMYTLSKSGDTTHLSHLCT